MVTELSTSALRLGQLAVALIMPNRGIRGYRYSQGVYPG